MNTNTSLSPFTIYEHQNCATTRTGVSAVPLEVQGIEGEKSNRSLYKVSGGEKKEKKLICRKWLFIRTFLLFAGGFGTQAPQKARKECSLLRATLKY
jgi:hypothetical protein